MSSHSVCELRSQIAQKLQTCRKGEKGKEKNTNTMPMLRVFQTLSINPKITPRKNSTNPCIHKKPNSRGIVKKKKEKQ